MVAASRAGATAKYEREGGQRRERVGGMRGNAPMMEIYIQPLIARRAKERERERGSARERDVRGGRRGPFVLIVQGVPTVPPKFVCVEDDGECVWIMQCRQFLAVRVEPTSRSVSLCSLQRSSTSRRGENLVREKDLRYT